ncbi:MAG: exonuclease SbcCD subunit D [Selenomonadaceae bacterium]|nr:exonuclease SbcCD subunit D [Selenomonadaceae bacterium]
MKIIHTADWHLGKTLKNTPLIDEQNYILNGEFMKVVDDVKPDAVIIAGDVYDRGVPPVDAVNLFDEIIFKLNEKKIPILCISGNHDNASRLNFAGRLLAQAKFFITTKPQENPASIVIQDNFGDVYFSLIPFFEPVDLRGKILSDDSTEKLSVDDVNKIYIAEARKKIPAGKRSVAVAHLFVTGGVSSDSERKFVGTVENVDKKNFAEYNYVALGHLHRPQTLSKNEKNFIRYSGSPLKYSFGEANHIKGVTFVELDGDGNVNAQNFELKPKHDIRVIKGTVEEICKLPRTEDFIHAQIDDFKNVLSAADRLRESSCPNLLSLEFLNAKVDGEDFSSKLNVREGVSPLEHFIDFYEYSTKEKMPSDYRDAMAKLISDIRQ